MTKMTFIYAIGFVFATTAATVSVVLTTESDGGALYFNSAFSAINASVAVLWLVLFTKSINQLED